MFYLNVCRSQTRQRVPDKNSQSNYLTPQDSGINEEHATKRVESSTVQYENSFSDLANNTDGKNSDYDDLKNEHEYSNTANVYSDLM